MSYSAFDNVLTNLLPAGLQDFFQVLISNATTTVNKLCLCSYCLWTPSFFSLTAHYLFCQFACSSH